MSLRGVRHKRPFKYSPKRHAKFILFCHGGLLRVWVWTLTVLFVKHLSLRAMPGFFSLLVREPVVVA